MRPTSALSVGAAARHQGDTLTQPQPLNTGASLSYTDPSTSRNPNGTYSFSYSITNHGPNSTQYNLQTASN